MNLIIARHGNTFLANQPAYYVGSQQDLPLVPFGIEQAHAIGQFLLQQNVQLTGVYTGPLQRMRVTAQEALKKINTELPITVDTRLNELDYGLWSGLTSQEVRERFGAADYEAWEQSSTWPAQGHWGESEQAVINRISDFSQHLLQKYTGNDTVLVVASNGCLRYFLKLIPNVFAEKVQQRQLKMGTGHLSCLQYQNNAWHLTYWNQKP